MQIFKENNLFGLREDSTIIIPATYDAIRLDRGQLIITELQGVIKYFAYVDSKLVELSSGYMNVLGVHYFFTDLNKKTMYCLWKNTGLTFQKTIDMEECIGFTDDNPFLLGKKSSTDLYTCYNREEDVYVYKDKKGYAIIGTINDDRIMFKVLDVHHNIKNIINNNQLVFKGEVTVTIVKLNILLVENIDGTKGFYSMQTHKFIFPMTKANKLSLFKDDEKLAFVKEIDNETFIYDENLVEKKKCKIFIKSEFNSFIIITDKTTEYYASLDNMLISFNRTDFIKYQNLQNTGISGFYFKNEAYITDEKFNLIDGLNPILPNFLFIKITSDNTDFLFIESKTKKPVLLKKGNNVLSVISFLNSTPLNLTPYITFAELIPFFEQAKFEEGEIMKAMSLTLDFVHINKYFAKEYGKSVAKDMLKAIVENNFISDVELRELEQYFGNKFSISMNKTRSFNFNNLIKKYGKNDKQTRQALKGKEKQTLTSSLFDVWIL